jgi:hypothetical protein
MSSLHRLPGSLLVGPQTRDSSADGVGGSCHWPGCDVPRHRPMHTTGTHRPGCRRPAGGRRGFGFVGLVRQADIAGTRGTVPSLGCRTPRRRGLPEEGTGTVRREARPPWQCAYPSRRRPSASAARLPCWSVIVDPQDPDLSRCLAHLPCSAQRPPGLALCLRAALNSA